MHHQLIDSCPTEDLFNGDSKGTHLVRKRKRWILSQIQISHPSLLAKRVVHGGPHDG